MSVDYLVVLAAISAAGSAFLLTPPHRLVQNPGSRRSSASLWLRVKPVLGAVEGAPTVLTRLAAAVTLACVTLIAGDVLGVPAAVPALACAVALFVVLGRWRPADLRDRDSALDADLPAVCTLLAVCLEAGLPLRNAVAAVAQGLTGPAAAALSRLDRAVRLGVPEPDAWAELGQQHAGFQALARELKHSAETGVSLAPVLRHHAKEAQRMAHAGAQARARKAGVSSVVPLMVCFLPAFILIGVVPIVGGVAARLFG